MKKIVAILLCLVMVLALAACSGAKTESKPAEKPSYSFKYAELNPAENINTLVGYKFAEYVSELSDGRITIEVFPSSQLGDEVACLNALKMGGGTVDFYRGNTNSLTNYGFKKLNLFGLPYVFTSRDNMWKVLSSEDIGQAFLNEGTEVGAGMVGIAYTDEGARHTFTSMEIHSLADLAGKKIRVPETELMMDTMRALGAEPTPISYSELYSSIQTGVVDGGENGYPGYNDNKFYEVAPYYLLDGHTFSPGIILMAEAVWNQLDAEDQAIIREAGAKASAWNKEQIEAKEAEYRQTLEGKDITIIDVPVEDMQAAQAACKEQVWPKYSAGVEAELEAIVNIQQ